MRICEKICSFFSSCFSAHNERPLDDPSSQLSRIQTIWSKVVARVSAASSWIASCFWPNRIITTVNPLSYKQAPLSEDLTSVVGPLRRINDWALHNKYPPSAYGDSTVDTKNAKYRERVSLLGSYYSKSFIRTAMADGNCFYNASGSILLEEMKVNESCKNRTLQQLRIYKDSPIPYIRENEFDIVGFTKEEDFSKVIGKLTDYTVDDSLSDQDFLKAFSRVIRYVAHIHKICKSSDSIAMQEVLEKTTFENYRDVDVISNFLGDDGALNDFNAAFSMHCRVAIVAEQQRLYDPLDASRVMVVAEDGRSVEEVDLSDHEKRPKENVRLILKTNNHFISTSFF